MGCATCWVRGGRDETSRRVQELIPLRLRAAHRSSASRTGTVERALHDPVLETANLRVTFGTDIAAVRGVSLTVNRGETHCLVGESGCGKSVTALAVMGLLRARRPPHRRRAALPRHRPDAALRTRHGAAARRPDGDDLPGADDQPEPRLHDRLADDRGAGPPPRRSRAPRHSTAPPNCWAASASPRRACGWGSIRTSFPAACASG